MAKKTPAKHTILLIEPDKVLAKTYVRALAAASFETLVEPDAQAAILAIDQKKPDVIITELQLAAHNGVEFLHELRSYPEWQDIPVVVLSQVPQAESGMSEQAAQKLGIKVYAYKYQTSLSDLTKIVASIL